MYINKFVDRFADQKHATGYTSSLAKNRDTALRCRVATEEAQLDTCASETPHVMEKLALDTAKPSTQGLY